MITSTSGNGQMQDAQDLFENLNYDEKLNLIYQGILDISEKVAELTETQEDIVEKFNDLNFGGDDFGTERFNA